MTRRGVTLRHTVTHVTHGDVTADGGSGEGGGVAREKGGPPTGDGLPHYRVAGQPDQGFPRGRRLGRGELSYHIISYLSLACLRLALVMLMCPVRCEMLCATAETSSANLSYLAVRNTSFWMHHTGAMLDMKVIVYWYHVVGTCAV